MISSRILGAVLLLTALVVLGYTFYQRNNTDAGRFFVIPEILQSETQPFFRTGFVETAPAVLRVHAATAAPVKDGIVAVWYGGTREGHKDVALYMARYHNQNGWGEAEAILDREQVAQQLGIYIRKLGNPVLHRSADGRLWLFFVTVSHGGWAGSQINFTTSGDDGASWSKITALISSPFVNISTLVKGKVVDLSEGVMGLPVYHEFIKKYGEFLRITSDGKVLHKSRIAHMQGAIQPVVIVHSKSDATAYLRASRMPEARVYQTVTYDGGIHWQGDGASALPNPDASLDALPLADGSILMVLNYATENRENLSLVSNREQGDWVVIETLESAAKENPASFNGDNPEYSYPFMLYDDYGNIHLLYTWHRTHIKHAVFNGAWLMQQEGSL